MNLFRDAKALLFHALNGTLGKLIRRDKLAELEDVLAVLADALEERGHTERAYTARRFRYRLQHAVEDQERWWVLWSYETSSFFRDHKP